MCGIVACVSRANPIPSAALIRMTESLAHRGPDGSGAWQSANGLTSLGHRRLAVLDVSGAGSQPMSWSHGRYWIVHNGEIYNFRELRAELAGGGYAFKTETDTEVLLAAYEHWGAEMLDRLRGMFAFGIWDARAATLFAARDRLGIKPLYYHEGSHGIALASEPRALLEHPDVSRDVDPRSLSDYLTHGYVVAPRSIYDGIRQVPPGSYLHHVRGTTEVTKYWEVPTTVERDETSWDTWLHRVGECFDGCVKAHLVSDVPVGAFLSGGVDSGMIVASLVRSGGVPPRIFTVGFPEADSDETSQALRVGKALGAPIEVVSVTAGDLESHLDVIVRTFDEPNDDYSAIPTYQLCKEARREVTVSLSGDGGDELFLGYKAYAEAAERCKGFGTAGLSRTLRPIAALALRGLPVLEDVGGRAWMAPWRHKLLSSLVSSVLGVRGFLHGMSRLGRSPVEHYARRMGTWSPEEASRLLCSTAGDRLSGEREDFSDGTLDPLSNVLRFALEVVLPGRMLTKVDRASMAHGLEVRVPFLDHELVELAATIPAQTRMRHGELKAISKAILGRRLPTVPAPEQKRSFAPPIRRWLQDPGFRRRSRQSIVSNPLIEEYLRRPALEQFFEAFRGTKDARRYWNLVVLDRWSREWLTK